ncbi:hypothetical protein ACN38_g11846 [Penicillium nordicum]|uniref:Uncharacterized protein n=1 Tax=Penicillium nordicum TaxID=229535 RepID=A0A0M9WAD0_9EURO|nr:hypothetical protein ACN38_g11846 [Penicillium nordicum]
MKTRINKSISGYVLMPSAMPTRTAVQEIIWRAEGCAVAPAPRRLLGEVYVVDVEVHSAMSFLAVISSLSVIYYSIAIAKNTAPQSPQPHSTSIICPMIYSILGPILIPHNNAPIIMPPLNHMIWIGLIIRVNRALAPIIMHP